MRTYLVVANLTLGGDHLLELLRDRCAQGPCRVHVLVPATPDPTSLQHTDEGDYAAARRRLEAALERFRDLGDDVEVIGEVGDQPVDSTLDVLRQRDVDEVILSTLPQGPSKWLRLDLPHRLERAVGDIPVTHVIGETEHVAQS